RPPALDLGSDLCPRLGPAARRADSRGRLRRDLDPGVEDPDPSPLNPCARRAPCSCGSGPSTSSGQASAARFWWPGSDLSNHRDANTRSPPERSEGSAVARRDPSLRSGGQVAMVRLAVNDAALYRSRLASLKGSRLRQLPALPVVQPPPPRLAATAFPERPAMPFRPRALLPVLAAALLAAPAAAQDEYVVDLS